MKKLIASLICSGSLILSAETLTNSERDQAMSHLHATRKAFLDSVAGLSDAQWNFKPAPERWSVAECAEHIAVSEDFIFSMIKDKVLQSPAAPDKKAEAKGKDEAILKGVPDRSRKFQAPEPIQPKHRWSSPAETVEHFKESRDRTIAFVEQTPEDLRSHFGPHPVMGSLDAYQWILLLSAHSERHTAQIKEVEADPNFPKKPSESN